MGILRRHPAARGREQDALQRRPDAVAEDGRRSSSAERHCGRRAAPGLGASWREYCNSTAIHGVRYFVEDDRTRCERVFWVLAVVLSLAGCSCFINKVHTKWRDTPVLVSFAERATPIRGVPFPAVTVCPEIKFRRSEFNFSDVYFKYEDYKAKMRNGTTTNLTKITDEELRYLEAVSGNVCIDADLENRTMPLESLDTLRKMAPSIDEVFHICEWNFDATGNCSELNDGSPLFRPFLTNHGLCYTFNMLSNKELFTNRTAQHYEAGGNTSQYWTLEGGYAEDAGEETFPRRSLGLGAQTGLHLTLIANKSDFDYLCGGTEAVGGFTVMVHSPVDIPHGGREFFRVLPNHRVMAVVRPSMMTTSDGLRDYSIGERQCFFSWERRLFYFETYTQKNCELECLANRTLRMCNCTGFHMPRSKEAEIPLCGSGSSHCYSNAAESLLHREAPPDPNRSSKKSRSVQDDCNCLPACTSLEYDVEITDADFDWSKILEAWRLPPDSFGKGVHAASVGIYFKQAQFITSRRSELFALTDFIANCGGLLGLFSGFSLISLIEILYYLGIRLWCNVHRQQRRQWRQRRQQQQQQQLQQHQQQQQQQQQHRDEPAAPASDDSDVEGQQPPASARRNGHGLQPPR